MYTGTVRQRYLQAPPTDHTHLHGIGEHASETERNLLRKLLPRHGNLETIAKVNVQDSASQPVQHQVGWVSGEREREIEKELISTSN